MITQTFPSTRVLALPPVVNTPVKSPWYTPQEVHQAQIRKITPMEYVRREEIIRLRHAQCPFKAGDTVFPTNKKDYQQYGAFIVSGVLSSYKDTAPDYEWSPKDNPLIVTIKSLTNLGNVMFCSSSWLTRTNTHLGMEACI